MSGSHCFKGLTNEADRAIICSWQLDRKYNTSLVHYRSDPLNSPSVGSCLCLSLGPCCYTCLLHSMISKYCLQLVRKKVIKAVSRDI